MTITLPPQPPRPTVMAMCHLPECLTSPTWPTTTPPTPSTYSIDAQRNIGEKTLDDLCENFESSKSGCDAEKDAVEDMEEDNEATINEVLC